MAKKTAMPEPALVPAGAPTPLPLPDTSVKPPLPTRAALENYATPPAPKTAPDPVTFVAPANAPEILYCGVCPAWKRAHPIAPFGQCLAAMAFMGSQLMTSDLGSCSFTEKQREEYANRVLRRVQITR